jgi:hypothetical protein
VLPIVAPLPTVNVAGVAVALFVTVVPDTAVREPIAVPNPFTSSVEVPFSDIALFADSAFAAPTFSVPELFTVVAPEYVFAPLNVSVPVPAFVSPTRAVLLSCITPAYVVGLLFPPTVSVNVVPGELLVTVVPDTPANETIVWLLPNIRSVDVPFSVTALFVSEVPPAASNDRTPAFTVVAPVKVFEPVNDIAPAPDFVSAVALAPS